MASLDDDFVTRSALWITERTEGAGPCDNGGREAAPRQTLTDLSCRGLMLCIEGESGAVHERRLEVGTGPNRTNTQTILLLFKLPLLANVQGALKFSMLHLYVWIIVHAWNRPRPTRESATGSGTPSKRLQKICALCLDRRRCLLERYLLRLSLRASSILHSKIAPSLRYKCQYEL